MQALIKTPDCFTMVATLLSPLELQRMRGASKEGFKAITKDIMLQCIKNTIARYAGPHAMADGVVRFYSAFGQSTFDICRVEEGVYQLKQEREFQDKAFDALHWDNPTEPKTSLTTLLGLKGVRLSRVSNYLRDRQETALLCFETNIGTAHVFFRFKLPADFLAPAEDEPKRHLLWDFDLYNLRLSARMPSPLLQIFEVRERVRALEALKAEYQALLTNRAGAAALLEDRMQTLEDVKTVMQTLLTELERIYAH